MGRGRWVVGGGRVRQGTCTVGMATASLTVDARSNDLLVVLVSAQVGRNRVDGTAAPDHGRHALDLRQAVQESNGCPHRLLFLRVFAQHDGAVVDELSGDIFTAQALNALDMGRSIDISKILSVKRSGPRPAGMDHERISNSPRFRRPS